MLTVHRLGLAFLIIAASACGVAGAQETNLLPKYGSLPKNEMQKAADEGFIASVDAHYKGDRKRASEEVSARGWQLLRQGKVDDAMRRFNQAWLLDSANGNALWGMANIQANTREPASALPLYAEAMPLMGRDIDFLVDQAKTMGVVGIETGNMRITLDALSRYARLYQWAPEHVLNLQNWAITLYHLGDYADAWKKIELAEKAPRHADLDRNFIAALQAKMPRP
jgi:tetratricopeptide (TPR) repeat protein